MKNQSLAKLFVFTFLGLLLIGLAIVIAAARLEDSDPLQRQLEAELAKFPSATDQFAVGILWIAEADTGDLMEKLMTASRDTAIGMKAIELGSSTGRSGEGRYPKRTLIGRILEPWLKLVKPVYQDNGHLIRHFKSENPAALIKALHSRWESLAAHSSASSGLNVRFVVSSTIPKTSSQ